MTVGIIRRFVSKRSRYGVFRTRRNLASPRSRLRGELLEGRQLLSVFAGQTLVNSTTLRDQYDVASASAPDGMSVTVWTHEYSSSNTDVYAQRFDAAGSAVGGQIRVATGSRNDHSPDVSMSANGDFVVVWAYDHSSSDTDIKAQRFNAVGSKRGGVITVSASSRDETMPSIATAGNGDFVVAWTHGYSADNNDVRARMYRDDGRSAGSAFPVASSRDNESQPDVARSPDGRFAISYYNEQNNGDVIVNQYSSAGSLIFTHTVASGSRTQSNPRIAMDNQANTLVVWQEGDDQQGTESDFDIQARHVSSGGHLGVTMTVSANTDQEVAPEVTIRRTGGIFLVSHQNNTRGNTIVSEMTTEGILRNQQVVATGTKLFEPATITFGVGNSYRVSYSQASSNGNTDVYARRGVVSPRTPAERGAALDRLDRGPRPPLARPQASW